METGDGPFHAGPSPERGQIRVVPPAAIQIQFMHVMIDGNIVTPKDLRKAEKKSKKQRPPIQVWACRTVLILADHAARQWLA